MTNARASGDAKAIEKAEKLYETAYKNDRTAQGALNDAKEKHEKLKTKYESDAKIENSHKYYKDTTSDINFISDEELKSNIVNNSQQSNGQTSNIIVEEHTPSRPRQEENTGTSSQDEYSRLVEQYNGETDPNRKAEIRRQLDDFERRH